MDKNIGEQLNKAYEAFRQACMDRDSAVKELQQKTENYEQRIREQQEQLSLQQTIIDKLKSQLLLVNSTQDGNYGCVPLLEDSETRKNNLTVDQPHNKVISGIAKEKLPKGPPTDAPAVDTAEQVYISSLALLKMLKHGRAGVPMEVMGLMLGEFVDDYTVRVIDVFAMPQSGTGVSVEAVDPVFQAKMLDMLKQTGRPEMVVGWYHSHPGFGCWLSGVDINTQQSFEALSERAVAVVVDPIQSVKGKVVIDAFRLINANMMVLGHEPRQTTSNLGHLNKPSIQALIHGLNRHYYSITINYRKNELEQKMLLNLHKKSWMEGLTLQDYSEHCKHNESVVKEMLELAKNYNKAVEEEDKMTPEQLAIKNVGKQDPKRHLEEHVDVLMTSNIVQCLAAMLDTVVFK
uniref:26S proteasome non-ATPase regulatory subunit 14 n=1 Tax=Papio anubis TaxID=9555 RepID=A0A096NWE5_PAPAN